MLKSKQVLTFSNVEDIYLGWSNQLEVSDNQGNELTIEMNDKLIIKLAEKLGKKADEIRAERIEAARQQLEELNESTETAD
jgi:hypothetical protein